MKANTLLKISVLAAVPLVPAMLWLHKGLPVVSAATRFTGPTSSQPLALSADDLIRNFPNTGSDL